MQLTEKTKLCIALSNVSLRQQLSHWLNSRNVGYGFSRAHQECQTSLYSDGHGGWTGDHTEARDYNTTINAIKAAREIAEPGLHLVLKFRDSRMDVSHPISDFKSEPPILGKARSIISPAIFHRSRKPPKNRMN